MSERRRGFAGLAHRPAEIEAVADLLGASSREPATLIVEGDPGIGKTTLRLGATAPRPRAHVLGSAQESAPDRDCCRRQVRLEGWLPGTLCGRSLVASVDDVQLTPPAGPVRYLARPSLPRTADTSLFPAVRACWRRRGLDRRDLAETGDREDPHEERMDDEVELVDFVGMLEQHVDACAV